MSEYKYDIGDSVNGLVILSRELRKVKNSKNKDGYIYVRAYNVKCKIDGYIHIKNEADLIRGKGCGVCSNRIIIHGINDIHTTNTEFIKYFKDVEVSKTVSVKSGKEVDLVCPECGLEKTMKVSMLSVRGFGCTRCGDSISYPNKFIASMLTQLNVRYEAEKVFDWEKSKRYDFYIPNLNCIIEVHGLQHYEPYGWQATLEEQRNNDKYKKDCAIKNGIKKYIEIDFSKSELEFAKNSIKNNGFLDILGFEFEEIDWNKCQRDAVSSKVKEICDKWNSGIHSVVEISEVMNMHRDTVRKYLDIGKEIGWCTFSDAERKYAKKKKISEKKSKKVKILNTNEEFNSVSELVSTYKQKGIILQPSKISNVCNGIREHHKGLKFKYI